MTIHLPESVTGRVVAPLPACTFGAPSNGVSLAMRQQSMQLLSLIIPEEVGGDNVGSYPGYILFIGWNHKDYNYTVSAPRPPILGVTDACSPKIGGRGAGRALYSPKILSIVSI
jgi:hypothetical protein